MTGGEFLRLSRGARWRQRLSPQGRGGAAASRNSIRAARHAHHPDDARRHQRSGGASGGAASRTVHSRHSYDRRRESRRRRRARARQSFAMGAPEDGTVIANVQRAMPQLAIQGDRTAQFDPLTLTWLGSLSSFSTDAYILVVNAHHPAQDFARSCGAGRAGADRRRRYRARPISPLRSSRATRSS